MTANMLQPLNQPKPTCNYMTHECSGQRVEGHDYCIRHILEDKSAPYKLCAYVYSGNGRRCVMPTPKGDKKESGYCAEHARKAQLARQKSSRRHVPPPSTESLLAGLSHYNKIEPSPASSGNGQRKITESKRFMDQMDSGLETKDGESQEDTQDFVTKALNPFVDIDAGRVNSSASRILDYASESDSDVEVTFRGETAEDISSDAESVDTEEVTLVTRDKLIRLQSLYIEQFRRLQHILKERRRRYLHALKREKETLSSIHNQKRESVREQKLYEKLRSLNHYHKRSGTEAVLHKKALERRAQATEGLSIRPAPTAKCIFTEGGVKCGERTLPVAKHCLKHILQDSHQVLFRPCGCRRADFICREPVPNILEGSSCVYHTNLPPPLPVTNLGLKMNGGPMETDHSGQMEINRSSTQDSDKYMTAQQENVARDSETVHSMDNNLNKSNISDANSMSTDTACSESGMEHMDTNT
ncbi:KAT8 regulatory NSL complex subunit 2 [Blattella germanica]|nr:KAT8 regulatory NSL complex subunit 2 [Blattella germanica]